MFTFWNNTDLNRIAVAILRMWIIAMRKNSKHILSKTVSKNLENLKFNLGCSN